MKKWMIISLFILGLVMVLTVSYAWFTYVQRKSLVKLTSHEIEVSLRLGSDILDSSLYIEGLSYVDFEEEVMNREISDGFNEVGLNYMINLGVSYVSPLVKVLFQMTYSHPELIVLLIDEGLDLGAEHVYVQDYHAYLKAIGSSSVTKDEFLLAIKSHNEAVINQLKTTVLKPGSHYQLQLVIWADYDLLLPEDDYQTKTYTIDLSVFMVSGKGDFDES